MSTSLKSLLIGFARRRFARQMQRRDENAAMIAMARNVLDPNVLTIGFARRFATYKRANLILSDVNRLTKMIGNTTRPIQLIFAGKAHPADNPGKELIRQITNHGRDQWLRHRGRRKSCP